MLQAPAYAPPGSGYWPVPGPGDARPPYTPITFRAGPPPPVGALHGELTQDGRHIVLISAGNAWEQSQIAVRLDRLTARWEETGTGAVLLPATWGNVVQLGHSFGPLHGLAWVPHERLRDWMADQVAHRYAEPPEIEPFWPAWLKPRGYQLDAARQIAHLGKFLLLDEAGTGKTLSTLLGIEQRRRTGITVFPLVILVPSWDVADAWDREIRKWMPPEWGEPAMYGGTGRLQHIRTGAKVLITTYATARKDAALVNLPLAKLAPPAVVIDEAHLIKGADAKQSVAARNIARKAATVVCLSGTLITRDMGDAFPPLATLDPDTWTSKERYARRFCLSVASDYNAAPDLVGLNPAAEPEFRATLLGQMLRRAKSDVLDELPPKTYSLRRPVIPEEWLRAYRQMEEDMLADLPDGGELSEMHSLSQLTRLSQLASSACDVRVEETWDEKKGELVRKNIVTLRPPSWKAESLLEIMAERPGQPVAVFTASRQLAMITGQYLDKAGYRYGYLVGVGDGVTRKTRTADIDAFQDGKLDAIICTAGAGALGITLTRAATAVMLQRPWPLDQAVQPEDRIHRFGQLADRVEIIDVVARDTIDERVRELLHTKAGRLSQFVRDPRIMRELLGGKR